MIEERVKVGDRGIPVLDRNPDLSGVDIVGRIDVHGVTVILRRKVRPVLLDRKGGTNHLGGNSGIERLFRTGRGHPLKGKSGSLKFLSGGGTCSGSRADRRGWLKILVADIASKETG